MAPRVKRATVPKQVDEAGVVVKRRSKKQKVAQGVGNDVDKVVEKSIEEEPLYPFSEIEVPEVWASSGKCSQR